MILDDVLNEAAQKSAYTIHLLPDHPPLFGVGGGMERAEELSAALTGEQIAALVLPCLPDAQQTAFASGALQWAETVTFLPESLREFHLCVFRSQNQTAALLRLLLPVVPTIEQIGGDTAPLLEEITQAEHGLLFFTGPYASGKVTTAFSVVDAVADARSGRVFLIENMASYRINKAYVTQWIIGVDVDSYETAARRLAKCDANVVYFADLPDRKTMQAALVLADTGHLVIANFAAESVSDALRQLMASFGENAGVLQNTLARTLVAIFNQRLLRRSDKPGRVAVYEVLWGDADGVRDALREARLCDVETLMETGANCQTRTRAFAALQAGGVIFEGAQPSEASPA